MPGYRVLPTLRLVEGRELCLCGCGEAIRRGSRWQPRRRSTFIKTLKRAGEQHAAVLLNSYTDAGEWTVRATTPRGYAEEVGIKPHEVDMSTWQ